VHAKALARVPVDARVLEVGCASGYLSEELKKRGCRVWGVEINPEAAEAARPHCEEVLTADVDALASLPWAVSSFDVVVCTDVLEHLKDPARALRLLKPYLRPGGCLIVSLPNVANWSVRFALLAGRFDYQASGLLDRTHLRFFSLASARRLLVEAGFRITSFDVTPGLEVYPPYLFFAGRVLRRLRLHEPVEYWLSRRFPSLLAYQFIFVAAPADGGPDCEALSPT